MELRRYLSMLRRRWLPVVLAVVAALVYAWVTTDRTPRYTTSATLYLGASQFDVNGDDRSLSSDRLAGLDRLIITYSVMIDSEPIAREALEQTGAPRSPVGLVNATTAGPIPNTSLLRIQVTDTDPVLAQELATGLAEAFLSKIGELEPGQSIQEGDLPAASATLFERAKLPTAPDQTSGVSGLALAGAFGFLVAAGLVFLVEYLDVTVKSVADVERNLELPVLGVVPIVPMPRPGARRSEAEPPATPDPEPVRPVTGARP